MQRTIAYYREYVVEILSCDEIHHPVASEKCDVLAYRVKQDIAACRELIEVARDMLAASQS
jgi:hypothetical protein